jgi:hypothetical protein
VTINRVSIGESIYWPLGTTSNYSATANLHSLEITTANTTSSPACSVFNSRFLATASNRRDSSDSHAQVRPVQRISPNWTPSIMNSTIAPSVFNLRCRAQLTDNSQLTGLSQSQSHIATDGQSVSLGVEPHLRLMTKYLLLFVSYGLVFVGRPLWREDGSGFCIRCWSSPAQFFSGPSPLVLATTFYSLRFETSLSVSSYDSQGHGEGIRPRLHTGESTYWIDSHIFFITPQRGSHRKHHSSIVTRFRFRGNVYTKPLLKNGRLLFVYCIATAVLVICFEVFA